MILPIQPPSHRSELPALGKFPFSYIVNLAVKPNSVWEAEPCEY
jgi:hypothetical protein